MWWNSVVINGGETRTQDPVTTRQENMPETKSESLAKTVSSMSIDIKPEKFTLQKDPVRWLNSLKAYVQLKNFSQEQSLAVSPFVLQDEALTWWETIDDSEKQSFNDICKIFITRFKDSKKQQEWQKVADLFKSNQRKYELTHTYIERLVRALWRK